VLGVQDLDSVALVQDGIGILERGLDGMREDTKPGPGKKTGVDRVVAREIDSRGTDSEKIDGETIHFDSGNEQESVVGVPGAVFQDGVDVALGEALDVLGHTSEVQAGAGEDLAELGVGTLAVERARRVDMRHSSQQDVVSWHSWFRRRQ
jgi:hypothetical protein